MTKKTGAKKTGRRGKYESHVKPKLMLVEAWARDGATEEQIARKLGIGASTLAEYKLRHPEFLEALKRGKEVADVEVENALFRNATGYEYEEEAVTNRGNVVRVRRFQHGNTAAQIFWLKNRRPDKWRDKQEVEHEVSESLADVLTKAWERMSKNEHGQGT